MHDNVPITDLWDILKYLMTLVIAGLSYFVRLLVGRVEKLEQDNQHTCTYEDLEKVKLSSLDESRRLRDEITRVGESVRKEIREQIQFLIEVLKNK